MSQIQEAWALDLAGRLGVPTSATQQTVDLTRGQASLLISALRGENAGPTGLNTDATRFANTVRDIRAEVPTSATVSGGTGQTEPEIESTTPA